MTTRLI